MIMPRVLMAFVLAAACADAAVAQQRRPEGFVDASTLVQNLAVEMRYFGSKNFVGRPIDGYEASVCLLTRQAATALASVARDLAGQGLGLKAFDCYRPARAVAHFGRWARDLRDVASKAEYYPDVDKRTLFRDGYIAAHSGHSRGSTVDLTLVKLADGSALDMGTPFDLFSPRSAPSDPSVGADARKNRALLAQAMRRGGFYAYGKEWWHFTLRGEPFPSTYFDFPVK
jgi:D-alanyl-D-alanine dipeptidase